LLTGLKLTWSSQQAIFKANAFYRQTYGINTVEESCCLNEPFTVKKEVVVIEELKSASSR
jgi:hypothetical protein